MTPHRIPPHHERPLVHLGIDLGGTSLRVGAFDDNMQLLATRVMPTRVRSGPQAVVADMADAIASLLDETIARADAIGLGSPGPLNLVDGTLGQLPNFPGWDFFPLRSSLEELTGLPVVLDGDANAAALAEWKLGAGRAEGVDSMAMITLGTGVGSGIILDGRIWQGMVGMGGEVGHVSVNFEGPVCSCGGRGCLEYYASATGIERAARTRADGSRGPLADLFASNRNVTARMIADLASSGDRDAREIYAQVGRYLGRGLAGLVNTLDLPLYVIGGGVAAAWNLFAPEMFRTLRELSYVYRLQQPSQLTHRELNRPFVARATLGPDAGLLGAAMLPSLSHTHSEHEQIPHESFR
ncbi:MAG TPA: ROK family protein [Acidobacteriaceae bacterium]|nr:ROK family protein [Acidobacteriaceae bacterium]